MFSFNRVCALLLSFAALFMLVLTGCGKSAAQPIEEDEAATETAAVETTSEEPEAEVNTETSSSNGRVLSATLIVSEDEDGNETPVAVAVEYDAEIDPESISSEAYVVSPANEYTSDISTYAITARYTNSEPALADDDQAGCYVILELSEDPSAAMTEEVTEDAAPAEETEETPEATPEGDVPSQAPGGGDFIVADSGPGAETDDTQPADGPGSTTDSTDTQQYSSPMEAYEAQVAQGLIEEDTPDTEGPLANAAETDTDTEIGEVDDSASTEPADETLAVNVMQISEIYTVDQTRIGGSPKAYTTDSIVTAAKN